MANGQQVAEENFKAFTAWVSSKTDAEYREMASRGVLARKEIATECGFAKSALSQNPRIKQALKELEDSLRERGVLPKAIEPVSADPTELSLRSPDGLRAAREAERLKRLEQENASLKAEVAELKRQLGRYAVLQDALAETGRLPR